MENKKIYTIQINGVQENINAIESLINQLDKLDVKIAELQKKKIEIDTSISNANSSNSNSGKENKSALSEEAKLLRNIQNTEAKIKAYSKDIYQNYLASKETLKKTLDDQKEIAAQERLQANTYTYTLNGLKQKLADIKQVMQTTEIDSDMFDKYQKEANELTTKLKDLEAKMGVFGRNVGNYQSAADGFNKIKVAVGSATREFGNYRQAMKELMQERFQLAQSLGQESEQYKEVDLAIRKLESDYKDLNKSSKFMDNMLDTMEGFTAMASIGTGFSTLFGVDNKQLDETVKELGALFTALKGFETLNKQLKSGDNPILNWLNDISKKVDEWALNKGESAGIKYKEGFLNGTKETDLRQAQAVIGTSEEESLLSDMLITKGMEVPDEEYQKALEDLRDEWEMLSKTEKEAMYVEKMHQERLKITSEELGKLPFKIRATATAFKLLGNALKMVGGAIAGLAAGFVLSKLIDGIQYLTKLTVDWIKGDADLIEAEDAINSKITEQNRILEDNLKLIDKREQAGDLSFLDARIAKEEAYAKALEESKKALDARESSYIENGISQKGKSGINLDTAMGDKGVTTLGGFKDGIKSIKDFTERFEYLMGRVENGQDIFGGFADTADDAKDELVHITKLVGGDFFNAMNRFADGTTNGAKSLVEYIRRMDEITSGKYSQSIKLGIDKGYLDGQFKQAWGMYEKFKQDIALSPIEIELNYKEFGKQLDEMADKSGKARFQNLRDQENYRYNQLAKEQQDREKTEHERRLKLIDKMEKEETKRHISGSKTRLDARKKMNDLEEELILLRLNNLQASLDKELKLIENQRRVEIKKKKEQLKELGLLEASGSTFEHEINVKYDKLILDEKRKWAFDMLKIYQDLANGIQDANKSTMEMEVGTATQNVNQKAEAKKTDVGNTLLTPTQFDDPNALEAYYREVIKIEEATAERQAAIRKEQLDKEIEYNRRAEEQRHERLVNLDGGEYIEQLRAGKITQEQYDKLIEDENDAHYAKMRAYDKQYESDSKQIAIDTMNDVQKAYSDGYGNMIDNIKNEKSKIDEIMAQQPVTDKMGWGIVNIAATSKNYKTALKQYDDLKNDIIAKQKELNMALEKGKISPEDFAIRSTELKQQAKSIDESTKSITQSQKELISDFIGSTLQYVNAIGNSLNSLLSTIWSAADAEFDYQMRQLDKQIDEYEELLDKQKEITQEHADEVNSIEDELKTARGDRRQQLIDNLNAEMAAQRASLAQEKKLEKEEEKLKAKKEREEEAQRKREQERQLIQAIISTALATANGLATKPFVPTGIAMGALAAALGAAQIAIISSQKYADGGVIQGKSHAQGGIKVLGGRAEVEGGEFITNKVTTSKNVELLEFINSKKKRVNIDDMIDFYSSGTVRKNIQTVRTKFADGGIIPTLRTDIDINDRLIQTMEDYSNRPVYVAVTEIENAQANVRNVRVLSGLEE